MKKYTFIKKVVAWHLVADFLSKNTPSSLEELLPLIYEAEYKYHKIKQDAPQEKEIMKYVEHKSKEIGKGVIDKLKKVYEEWLKKHAILEPEQWAEERLRENEEIGEDIEEALDHEFQRYSKTKLWSYKNIKLFNLNKMPEFKKWLDIVQDEYNSNKEENEEDMSLETVLELALDDSFKEYMQNIKRYNLGLYNNICAEFYENLVFPVWYAHWKSQGIDKTRKRIEDVYKDLKRATQQAPDIMFKTINIALNTSHQTGEMMDYVESHYNVSKNDLQDLSDKDTSKWDLDLKKLLK